MPQLCREKRPEQWKPNAKIWEGVRRAKCHGYTLQVEMPGVNKEGLEMWVENNELTVICRRSQLTVSGTTIHRESRRENFRRTFEVDPSIDAGKVSAKIEQGVVTLTLPKAEQVKRVKSRSLNEASEPVRKPQAKGLRLFCSNRAPQKPGSTPAISCLAHGCKPL